MANVSINLKANDMKNIINELKLSGLTPKEKAKCLYLVLSLCLFTIAESSIVVALLVATNFCIAAILVKDVKFSKMENDGLFTRI